MQTFKSDLSNKEFPVSEKISGRTIRHSIFALIQMDNPEFTASKFLSVGELNEYKHKYAEAILTQKNGELSDLEKSVLTSMKDKTTISDNADSDEVQTTTFGQRIADKVAAFGGSWTFIISFGVFLFGWIMLNVFWLANKGFDPYPFILLNLILSSIAALQAPVIMMSQNRQEAKDRERGKKDYMVNLKSELEIRMLHEKIDHMIISQQQDVIDTQKQQIEILNDILKRITKD